MIDRAAIIEELKTAMKYDQTYGDSRRTFSACRDHFEEIVSALAAEDSQMTTTPKRDEVEAVALRRIMDAAWPEFGGSVQHAGFWEGFSQAVQFTLKQLPDAAIAALECQ